MPDTQRIKLLRDTAESLNQSEAVLLQGEICLVNSGDSGYDSLVIGDGVTKANSLKLIPLNVSKGSVFLGKANPMTIPGTPTDPVFYVATEGGTYEGFGNLVVENGEITILAYRYGGWNKITILQVDSELSETSENPVQNKVVTKAIKNLEEAIIGGDIKVFTDEEFSDESENPVMNRTITKKFKEFEWYEGEQTV